MGHIWIPATYDEPKTCSRCKGRQGSVKGFISAEELEQGDFSDTATTYNSYNTYPYEFKNELIKCRKIKIGIKVVVTKGEVLGEYMYLARSNGQWRKIGTVNIDKENVLYNSTLIIDPAINIDAIDALPVAVHDGETEFSVYFFFHEAQVE